MREKLESKFRVTVKILFSVSLIHLKYNWYLVYVGIYSLSVTELLKFVRSDFGIEVLQTIDLMYIYINFKQFIN